MTADTFGPYENEREALAAPMPREVRALHDAGMVRSGDPARLGAGTALHHLEAACIESGVVLGAYDRRVLAWLADGETSTTQVVIGLIRRAHAAAGAS